MLGIFGLRLACGMLACLLLLSPAQVNPRFYRTHFLTAFGLTAVAAGFLRQSIGFELGIVLGLALALTLLGSIVWMLQGAPLGRMAIWLAVPTLGAALLMAEHDLRTLASPWLTADSLTSTALLGAVTTAMLMGHSYLLAPSMSLAPLKRLLFALGAGLGVRLALAAVGLWIWTWTARAFPASAGTETETLLWLGVRWVIGLVAPLVLGWLAWETASIRSTQSATGILYVVVILCFLGELTSLLLSVKTGFVM